MLFHFLNFSQCVVCMFGHKKDLQSYKSQSPLQMEIFFYFLSLFKNYNERLVWTTDSFFFSSVCDFTKQPIRISLK